MSKSRTIEQRHSYEGIVKAGEVIEIRHSSELTLHDKRILNLLIENAGPGIVEEKLHRIQMSQLRGPMYKSSERVKDSIVRLMRTLVEIPTRDGKGNRATRRTQLLCETTTTDDEDSPGAEVIYSFSPTVREIILKSTHWGRIKAYVMFAFSSKYALSLYELICLRGNLNISRHDFSVEDFRQLLGVPDGKLDRAPDLLRRVVQPAIDEVNSLSDFDVSITPLRDGGTLRGRLTGLRLEWQRKSPEDWQKVLDELGRSKVGRKARLSNKADNVLPLPSRLGWPSV